MIRKTLLAAAAAVSMLAVSVGGASANETYEGGWYTDNNLGGSEVLYLGDNSDDTYLHLSGASGYCGQPGASYARMRSVIGHEYDQITWSINQVCSDDYGNDFARICVQNSYGDSACSTYREVGWE